MYLLLVGNTEKGTNCHENVQTKTKGEEKDIIQDDIVFGGGL